MNSEIKQGNCFLISWKYRKKDPILLLLDNTGNMAQDSTTINEIFTFFYSALYSPKTYINIRRSWNFPDEYFTSVFIKYPKT